MRSLVIILLLITSTIGSAQDSYQADRMDMVKYQIEGRGVRDEATLRSMREVPRHLFVPEKLQSSGYEDSPLPIGYGQTISQPYIVAYMTQALELGKDDVVLEIGTGSGYQAAVLAKMVKEVHTIEIVEELARSAKERLQQLDYDNVNVYHRDGYHGLKDFAPFDGIMVTAAAEYIPPPLVDQLKEGCKMIIPVGSPYFVQQLVIVTKRDGKVKTRNVMPVRFVPFTRMDQ